MGGLRRGRRRRGGRGRPDRIEAAGERRDLGGLPFELERPGADGFLAALDRGPAQLDGTQLARALGDPVLRDRKRGFAPVELSARALSSAWRGVELGGALPENLLDAGVELARALLAALEIVDGRQELLGAHLELAAVHGDEVGDGVAGVGRREQAAETAAHACLGQLVRGIATRCRVCA